MAPERNQVHHALGVDFGTSNSYFSDVRVGGLDLAYTDLKFHNGQSSVPTCVLYRIRDEDASHSDSLEGWEAYAFGEAAIELWKDLLDDERKDYRFRGGFKPDITFEQQAFRDAVSFFKCVRGYLQEQRLLTHFSPASGRQVVVGVPARNVEGQEKKTIQALEEAGIFEAILVPEPEGALFYHLYYDRSRITVERAHQGVLVIDFGGGTFDVAYLRDGDVQSHWGNPMLGGRLFDDLFYQWFLEQQEGPSTRQRMLEDGTLSYLRTFGFRRLKERFSSAWSDDRLRRFRERITVGVDFDYGVFRNATVDDFLHRAQEYEASEDLLQDLELLQDESANLLRQGKINLLTLIREQLAQTKALFHHGAEASVSAVILTGGSCRWPFVTTIANECFPQAELFQSPDPEATISRGLALSYAFREYAKEVGTSLQDNQRDLREQILDAIQLNYRTFARRVSEAFTSELYTSQLQPLFEAWREEGGSIQDLEEKTRNAAQSYFDTNGKKVIAREQIYFQERVEQIINDCVFAWLRKHRVTRTDYLSLEHLNDMQQENVGWSTGLSQIMDNFFSATKWVISGLIGVVIASLAGGGGVALIMTGPVGWLIGLILGGAAALSFLSNVDTKSIKLPPLLLKMTATKERLLEAQFKFREDVEENLIELFTEQQGKLSQELNIQIAELIARLSQHIPVTAIIEEPESFEKGQ